MLRSVARPRRSAATTSERRECTSTGRPRRWRRPYPRRVPEFDLARPSRLGSSGRTVWIRTRHRPEFRRNAFLRLPIGSTREEVRARIGDGYSGIFGHGPNPEWNAVAEWYTTEDLLRKKQLDPKFVFPDASPSWLMTGWENSESYWRCWVSFDENGRLDEKYIGWWWD